MNTVTVMTTWSDIQGGTLTNITLSVFNNR